MIEWNRDEKRALRGRSVSRWLGDVGESLRGVLYLLFRIVQFMAEGSVVLTGFGCALHLFGVPMSWSGEELIIVLVASIVAVCFAAGLAETLKR